MQTTWNLAPPPDFQGLREDLPVEFYMRHMPHWRQAGATYFVTFRLGDSLPQNKLRELDGLRREWERRHPPPHGSAALESLARQINERVERWLDQGFGSCVLRETAHSAFVTEAMHHFDDDRYELDAYVVMPNHVHAILRPKSDAAPLEFLLKSWKQFSSKNINQLIRTEGSLWQDESYDRIIRDAEHLDRCLQYIGRNPKRAGLTLDLCRLWVRPEWAALGWTFRDTP